METPRVVIKQRRIPEVLNLFQTSNHDTGQPHKSTATLQSLKMVMFSPLPAAVTASVRAWSVAKRQTTEMVTLDPLGTHGK